MTTTEIENTLDTLMSCLIMLEDIDIAIKDEMLNLIYYTTSELNGHLSSSKELSFGKFINIKRFAENTHRMLNRELNPICEY